jgi:hypothetical protein
MKPLSRPLLFACLLPSALVAETAPAPDFFAPKPLVLTPGAPARLVPPAPDAAPGAPASLWFVDFGQAAFGTLRFRATAPADGHVVTVHLGEVLGPDRRTINRNPGGSRRYRAVTQTLRAGTHDYQLTIPPDHRNTGTEAILMPPEIGEVMPFRYAELEKFPGTPAIDDLRQVRVHYPFDDSAARFTSSSKVLNDVWDLCKYSIRATTFTGLYVDGDRERIPYEGDALINQLGHYCLDREFAPARRTLEHLFEHPTWPVEWHQHMPLIAWEEYLNTGADDLLRRRYDDLVAKLLLPLARPDGLLRIVEAEQSREFLATIGMKRPIRTLIDWPVGERDGHRITPVDSVVNAFHYRGLVVMADIAAAIGRPADADRFRATAARVAEAYQRVFFDHSRGLYRDGEGVDHYSAHANLFPLAFDLVPPEHRTTVLAHLTSRGMACSVYGAQHLLDGLYRAGAADTALALLTSAGERSWAHMLYTVGSTITLEAWDNRFKPNQDWNHAWGAAPANLIPRRLFGLEPITPGFTRARIRPQPASLEHARLRQPTLLGPVEISLRQDAANLHLEIALPPGMSAELHLPGASSPTELRASAGPWRFSVPRAANHSPVGGAAIAQPTKTERVKVACSETIPNARHPQLLYWFWTNETIRDRRYLQDIREITEKSRFGLAMMTDRSRGEGAAFHDVERMHAAFAEAVKEAHARGLKIGLQLWAEGYPKLDREQAVACVTEGEVTLDADGRAEYSAASRWVREGGADATLRKREPIVSEPLKAFAFRKTSDGGYDPGSLVELPASALRVMESAPSSVKLAIQAPPELAGRTVYVLVAHYLQFPDLFNDVMPAHLLGTLRSYRDIPFDGTALDEFGWMMIKRGLPDKSPFRDRFYGKAFAQEFHRQKGRPLETELFRMRYAPEEDPAQRIRAINDYFEVMRQAPLRIEQAFHGLSKQLFGPETFAGIHNTFHNGLESDEIWRTGLNWWRIPREYGQSDEKIGFPVRMGLLVNAPQPVMYDQFYTPVLDDYAAKVMAEARYNVRTHYHAWNDKGKWGRDMGDDDVLTAINALEEKIRLLNRFDPAPPKLPLLVVFGMPAQLNWFPRATLRNTWDVSALKVEAKATAAWNAGYACALVPSDLIDDGKISVNAAGKPVINGHVFDAMIYLYPEYATPKTLDFLEQVGEAGGRFMLEGEASRDFSGADITKRFADIAAKATVRGFDLAKIPALGISPRAKTAPAELEDGSVVYSDLESFKSGNPKSFEVKLGRHTWTGAYVGVFALKANEAGEIEKLAGGGLSWLQRDGRQVLSLSAPSDIVLRREQNGTYQALIKSGPESPRLSLE